MCVSLSHQTSAVEHDDSSSVSGGMEALLCLSLTRLALWNTMIAVVLVMVWRFCCVSVCHQTSAVEHDDSSSVGGSMEALLCLSLTRLALWSTMIAVVLAFLSPD